jgi:hypothetical protein
MDSGKKKRKRSSGSTKKKKKSSEKKKSKSTLRTYKADLDAKLKPFLASRWILYILISQNEKRTYCGITINFVHRFRQHLGLIKGGALYTKICKGVSNEQDLSWRPVCLVSGWDSDGSLTRKCEFRMHHPTRYKGFRQWKTAKLFPNEALWPLLKVNSGIQYRLLCLHYFMEEFHKQADKLQICWITKDYRQNDLWKNSPFQEIYVEGNIFEGIQQEVQTKKKSVTIDK